MVGNLSYCRNGARVVYIWIMTCWFTLVGDGPLLLDAVCISSMKKHEFYRKKRDFISNKMKFYCKKMKPRWRTLTLINILEMANP